MGQYNFLDCNYYTKDSDKDPLNIEKVNDSDFASIKKLDLPKMSDSNFYTIPIKDIEKGK